MFHTVSVCLYIFSKILFYLSLGDFFFWSTVLCWNILSERIYKMEYEIWSINLEGSQQKSHIFWALSSERNFVHSFNCISIQLQNIKFIQNIKWYIEYQWKCWIVRSSNSSNIYWIVRSYSMKYSYYNIPCY